MAQTYIPISTFNFLSDLAENNNRDWFNANKERYLQEHASVIAFAEKMISEMEKIDNMEGNTPKGCLHRIYRDTRFSKDKTPYKTWFSGGLKRPTNQLRGGYFFRFKPGDETVIGGGFYNPNSADLKLIRDKIARDDKPLRKIINAASFKKYFGTLKGDQLKTAPRGFPKDHPALDLLRYKNLYAFRSFSDDEVTKPGFVKEVIKTWKGIRPFFDYMSEVLTTDMNGVDLYD